LCQPFGGFLRGFQLIAICRELSYAGLQITKPRTSFGQLTNGGVLFVASASS